MHPEGHKTTVDRVAGHVKKMLSVKEEVEQIDELTDAEISKLHSDAESHLKKSMDKQSDARIAAHKNPPAKKGFFARVGQKQINMVKGAYHGLTKEEVELEEGDLTVRTLYNKFANAHVNGNDTKPTEKAITKVHGDVVMGHMKKAAKANAKGDMDGEERHFDNAQTAAKKTDRIGGTVGRGRSEFMRKRREWSEEVEQIDEKSEQAKRNKIMKNVMAASKGAQINRGLKLDPAEYGYKRAQHLNVAIGRQMMKAEEVKKDDVPFDGPYTKTKPVKNSDGTTQSPMSRARQLAKDAMKKQMKEHFDIEMTDEQADSILDHIDEQAPVAPVPDKKYIKGTPEHKAYKATKKPINGMPTCKESFDADGNIINSKVSYKEFLQSLDEVKMADLPSRKIQGKSYGADYADPEGADDADDKKPKQQPAEKRGRGRPAGAKSGAGKITGTSKLYK
jgi:hypothetical protein